MNYNFKQELTREDYISFVTNHLRQGLLKPLNILFFTISIGYLLVSPLLPGNEGNYGFTLIGLALLLVLGAMIYFARRSASKRYESVKDEFKVEFTMDENTLRYELEDQRFIEKQWMEFYSAYERGDYIYLYVSKNSGIVIVTRDLQPEIVRFIRASLTKHLQKRRLRLKQETK
jgi:LPXTG-motif cell wall-anchored protein